jgi:hypothetical protein
MAEVSEKLTLQALRTARQAAIRLLIHPCQESRVAGVVADGVEEWIHADECHVEAVAVDGVLERLEGMVEFVDAKIIDADLVSGAGVP